MTDFTAPTQSEHPWKATIRTVFQMAVGLAAILPLVIDDLTGAGPWAAAVVGIAAAVTRIMALPQVNDYLDRFVPWLSAR